MFSEVRKRAKKVGQPPGTATYTGSKNTIVPTINVITYDANGHSHASGSTLAECLPEPLPAGVTWVDVTGLHDIKLIDQIAKRFNLHPLTIEDILNVEQRPKVEEFEGYTYITFKTLSWNIKTSSFSIKQLSLILGKNFVLSFHELESTLFDLIHARLESNPNQRLRQQGSDYLVYRLIDAVVDQYFIILEALGDLIETIEERIIAAPKPQNARSIYRLKRQMLLLKKTIWPMREVVNHLLHGEDDLISAFTRLYIRDVYDHTVQAIDAVETFRDVLASLLDMYLSSLTNRMNEIMKTLTIITTIFIPITAIASIYGMNFAYMPGIHWHYGYYTALGVMLAIAALMVIYFKTKKWF